MAKLREDLRKEAGVQVPKGVFKNWDKWLKYRDRRTKFLYTSSDMFYYNSYRYKQIGSNIGYTKQQFRLFLISFFKKVIYKIIYDGLILKMGHYTGRFYLSKNNLIPTTLKNDKVIIHLNLDNFRKCYRIVWDKHATDDVIKNLRVWTYRRADDVRKMLADRLLKKNEIARKTPVLAYETSEITELKVKERANELRK